MLDGISVLIPVYNGARYLSECIESVRRQTLPAAEIIVVDDGSEDETPEVAASWGPSIRYQRVAHGGLACARNHALDFAQTEFIAFIDSDDVWLPQKLELQMSALSREAETSMAFCRVQQFISSDLTPAEAAELRLDAAPQSGQHASALLMRKRDCERAGRFDESIQIGEFIEWCARAADAGVKPVMVPEVLCRRRLHRANMGRGGAGVRSQYVHMLKKVLDRWRGRE
jgi:glycosyltransferase involved in cell wall biosynthesis